MNLPSDFTSTIQNTFGEEGRAFLGALPDSIAEASARWGLTDVQPVPNLSYNFVAFARRGEVLSPCDSGNNIGQGPPAPTKNVVLKMGVPNSEMDSEMAALRLFNGEGACRLLECDEGRYWMLLERLSPGVMLAMLENDEEAMCIAAEVMKRIWRPLGHVALSRLAAKSLSADVGDPSLSLRITNPDKFIRLADWFDGLKHLRKMFNGGTGPLDEKLVERAESSARDFLVENHRPVLMHGDFRHFNVLSSERGWLVIDPKGVIGPAGHEVGPLMMNPWDSHFDRLSASLSDESSFQRRTKRRIDILHEHLGFKRERILEWTLAHAILSAWWGIEDNTGWDYAMAFAGMIASL